MPGPSCPACGLARGSNAECLSCREAAARELARDAEDVTPERLAEAEARAGRYLARPPWWARGAPRGLMTRLRLMWMVLRDLLRGDYRAPWRAVAVLAAAALYVVAPIDLLPDVLGPLGFTDDVLVVALAFSLVRRQLTDYCAWKGLSPSHFGLGPR